MATELATDRQKQFITRREFIYALGLSIGVAYGLEKLVVHPGGIEQKELQNRVYGSSDSSILDLPGLPDKISNARYEEYRLNSGIIRALDGQYVPIVDSDLKISQKMQFGNYRLALLNYLPGVINPNKPNDENLDKFTGRKENGLIYYQDSIGLSAVPLNGVSDNLIAINAVRLYDNSGLQDTILLDKWSGEIKGSMPSVFPKSSNIEFRAGDNGLGLFVNDQEMKFNSPSHFYA